MFQILAQLILNDSTMTEEDPGYSQQRATEPYISKAPGAGKPMALTRGSNGHMGSAVKNIGNAMMENPEDDTPGGTAPLSR